MRTLFLPCKRYLWMSLLLSKPLGINKFLRNRHWISEAQAIRVQSWLIALWISEQKRLCRAHMQVIEADFASGQIPSLPEYLSYFYDLRSLEAEGRYESVLVQLYQLDLKG